MLADTLRRPIGCLDFAQFQDGGHLYGVSTTKS